MEGRAVGPATADVIEHRRDHPVGISAETFALAWVRTERAPSGAAVVTGQEISPRGFNGRLWTVEPEQTVAMAVVLRPEIPTERADGLWLAAGLAARDAVVVVGGTEAWTRWPDAVADGTGHEIAMVKVQVQLGPAGVRSAVATIRVDLRTAGLVMSARAALTDAIHEQLVVEATALESEPDEVTRLYGERSDLIDRRVKVELLPTGETRGTADGFEAGGAIRLGAGDGVYDRIPIDAVRRVHLTDRP